MLAKVLSGATVGLTSIAVTVEVDISMKSLPSFTIVGLPSKSIEESKERVRAAIRNSGAEFPPHRITVNLAPADLPKEGPSYDLPIALGILIASGQIESTLDGMLLCGELSLDGSLRHTNGILPLSLLVKEKGYKGIFLPEVNAKEAAIVKSLMVYPVASLIALFHHMTGVKPIPALAHIPFHNVRDEKDFEFDFLDIRGQEQGKRAMSISAAGGHNVLLRGVPGAGKTMLARALPGILPSLTQDEALEVTKIYSITGNIPEGTSIISVRPFRAPHHTTSRVGLIGGGTHPMPGEISLAHRGVLFLDELPEFPRHVLEALRQPMEDGVVSISRAAGTTVYPAKFTLAAACNPCPCGYLGDTRKSCRCMPGSIASYQKRLSGPLLDRIDLHLDLPPVGPEKLTGERRDVESSGKVRGRVEHARQIQLRRYRKTSFKCNSDLRTKEVERFIPLSSECARLLHQAVSSMHLSARGYFRTIKVARTIADLELAKEVSPSNVAEALQYRVRDDT